MPTYEYECTKGHQFEVFQSIKDKPLTRCRRCKAKARRMLGTGSGIIFKGSGFYETDYKRKPSSESSEKKSSTSKKSDSK
jgi:putative FmdB family regulatory protein